jgi:glyoxylase-like metal-dependent hydrolase (beta-lactamase superfamily II)
MKMPIAVKDITIHPVVEQQGAWFEAFGFFPALTKELLEENRSWLQPTFLDASDKLVFCIQSFVIKTPDHNILVDACVGNHKPRPTRPFWDMLDSDRFEKALTAAGLTVNDIDYVMCTHLHGDHVGWNTRLENGRWVPTFPKARYLFSKKEYEFWTSPNVPAGFAADPITESVLPVVEANKAELVTSDHALNDHIRLMPTPGHTPDHFAVRAGKGKDQAVFTGDLIHSPIQARYPELVMRVDTDRDQGVRTRRAFFEKYCDTDTLCCTMHFPSPSVGHIKRWGDGFKLDYLS